MYIRHPFQCTKHLSFLPPVQIPLWLLGNNCGLFQLEGKYSGRGSHASCVHCMKLLTVRTGRVGDVRALGSSPCPTRPRCDLRGHRSTHLFPPVQRVWRFLDLGSLADVYVSVPGLGVACAHRVFVTSARLTFSLACVTCTK